MIAAYCLSLLSVNINGVVLSRHEVLAAQPAREMLSDGHWIVPTFVGEPRVNKPPTMGWLIAASMAAFGSREEWVARLPAMLAAAAVTSVLAGAIAARPLGRAAGLIAGLTTATSYFVLMQGRLSEADMPMAACVAGAMWVFLRVVDADPPPRRPGAWAAGFYGLVGMSFLLKGVGPAFVLPACLAFALVRRDGRALRFLVHPAGLATLLVLVTAWPLAAWLTYPPIAEAWHREVFQRVSGELSEQVGRADPWYAYFEFVPLLLVPWFPLTVVGAVVAVRRGWHRTPAGTLLLCWFGCGFVLLSAVAWRNKHYAIPIAPACAAATAAGFLLWVRHSTTRPAREGRVVQAIFVAACVVGGIVALSVPKLDGRYAFAAAAALLAVGGAGVIECFIRGRGTAATVGVFATAWAVAALAFWQVVPLHGSYRPSAELGRRVSQVVPAGQRVYLVRLPENHVAYYVDRPMRRVDDPGGLASAVGADAPAGPVHVLGPASAAEAIAGALGPMEMLDQIPPISRRQKPEDRLTFWRTATPVPAAAPASTSAPAGD